MKTYQVLTVNHFVTFSIPISKLTEVNYISMDSELQHSALLKNFKTQ